MVGSTNSSTSLTCFTRDDHFLSGVAPDPHLTHARCYSDLQNVAKAMINALHVNLPKNHSTNANELPILSNTYRYLCCSSCVLDSHFVHKSFQGFELDDHDQPQTHPISMDIAPVRSTSFTSACLSLCLTMPQAIRDLQWPREYLTSHGSSRLLWTAVNEMRLDLQRKGLLRADAVQSSTRV
jgi:hypothetical protein